MGEVKIGGFAVILRCGCVLACGPSNPLTVRMAQGRPFKGCVRCEERHDD